MPFRLNRPPTARTSVYIKVGNTSSSITSGVNGLVASLRTPLISTALMDSVMPSFSELPAALLRKAEVWTPAPSAPRIRRPLAAGRVSAGFPSPAADYVERELDIAALLIANAPATYFVRIEGTSMAGAWIRPGDIAVVDCSLEAKAGQVVIAILDGELVIKQLGFALDGTPLLIPQNKRYRTITVQEGQDFQIWGVVTWTIHRQGP